MDQRVSLYYKKVSLENILTDLSNTYGINFSYSPDKIPVDKEVSINLRRKPMRKALDYLFSTTPIVYMEIGDQIVLSMDDQKPIKKPKNDRIGKRKSKKEAPEKILTENIPPKRKEPEKIPESIPKRNPGTIQTTTDNERSVTTNASRIKNFQFSFAPFLGTDYWNAKDEEYRLSVNFLGGYVGSVNGMEFGLGANWIKNNMRGLQIAGAANFVNGVTRGTQIAGLFNQNKDKTEGLQIAGLFNNVEGRVTAFQWAGLFNIVRGDLFGFQFAGLFNLVEEPVEGVQLASLFNRNYSEARLQFAGIFNQATEVQVGQFSLIYNEATYVKGFQIGLVNVCDSISGIPLGILNLVRYGYNRVELSGGETLHASLSTKLGAHKFYNILQLGFHFGEGNPMDTLANKNISWAIGYGIGTAKIINEKSLLNFELVAMHLNEGRLWTNRLNLLNQVRITYDRRLKNRLSFFIGPTFHLLFSRIQLDSEGVAPPDTRLASGANFSNIGDGNRPVRITGWLGIQGGVRF